jgi:predicted dehydrogenase/threonine dehydrogenase-like Zn-dependent dehydrogenase
MLIEFGRAGLISKARQQPERVRQSIEKMRTDGLLQTVDAVRAKLDQPLPLGYCNAGVVLAVGKDVEGFVPGDRVVSNGYHAEVVSVPRNLCARIPHTISDEIAVFTVLGAIALQGVRLAKPTLGERFVVSGLGMVGLLTAQILRASGCSVMGLDPALRRVAAASQLGVAAIDISRADPLDAASQFSDGEGADGVIITASTPSSAPLRDAARMCRKRGRIVLVGVTGCELPRSEFYHKELSFQVSCSYGPGRYDEKYEIGSHEYPLGFVRWTAQRNFEAILQMLADGQIGTAPLVSHRFDFKHAGRAFELLASKEPSLGVLIDYPGAHADKDLLARTVALRSDKNQRPARRPQSPVIAFVGPGNFASKVLLPNLRSSGARLKFAVSANGLSGAWAARKFGFEYATTDVVQALRDPEVTAVMIATRHDTHASLVSKALEAGKHAFVEKPLALNEDQLLDVEAAWARVRPGTVLMVGFNRRFAPQVQKIRSLLEGINSPKAFVMTVNAGSVPLVHWSLDPAQGGGRIIGEGCHFVDLLRFLAGHPVTEVKTSVLGRSRSANGEYSASISLRFGDGSIGTIHYFANGHRTYPKELLQVFVDGGVLELKNFRRLRGYGWPHFSSMNLWRQDKGHAAEIVAFLDAIRSAGPSPVNVEEIFEVTRISLSAARHPEGD